MPEFNGGKYLFSFLTACVFLLVDSQIICRMEIDSTQGLWLDTTSESHHTNTTTFCAGYLFRETNLSCSSQKCQPASNIDTFCTLYYNAETLSPILTTCTSNCTQKLLHTTYQIQNSSRYNKTKMCVPNIGIKNCPSGQFDENGTCIPKLCSETCWNGRCDFGGSCTCLSGYSRDPKTDKCVNAECLNACTQGTCDVSGNCICKNGLVNDKRERFMCKIEGARIKMQINRWLQLNVIKCMENNCENVRCENNECMCNEGYKKNSNVLNLCGNFNCSSVEFQVSNCTKQCKSICECDECSEKCVRSYINSIKREFNESCIKINCSSENFEDNDYCKAQCELNCKNGRCQDNGLCDCDEGFKMDTDKGCIKINCPSTEFQNYCASQCNLSCKNGECSYDGVCTCEKGFKMDIDKGCIKINCPLSVTSEEQICRGYCESDCQAHCNFTGCSCKSKENIHFFKYSMCVDTICPSLANEEQGYCFSLCQATCENGECNARGECECSIGFSIGSCTAKLVAICVSVVISGVVVISILIVAAVYISRQMRAEQFVKDNGRFCLPDFEGVLPTVTDNPHLDSIPSRRECDTYLEPKQPIGVTQLIEESNIYDTPYDHFMARGLRVGPSPPVSTAQYFSQEQAINAKSQLQDPVNVIRPPDVLQIQQQLKRLRAVESSRVKHQ